jgi:hypothetical protein
LPMFLILLVACKNALCRLMVYSLSLMLYCSGFYMEPAIQTNTSLKRNLAGTWRLLHDLLPLNILFFLLNRQGVGLDFYQRDWEQPYTKIRKEASWMRKLHCLHHACFQQICSELIDSPRPNRYSFCVCMCVSWEMILHSAHSQETSVWHAQTSGKSYCLYAYTYKSRLHAHFGAAF